MQKKVVLFNFPWIFASVKYLAFIFRNTGCREMGQDLSLLNFDTLQTHHVYFTLKRLGNGRFHVVLTWNTRGLLVG